MKRIFLLTLAAAVAISLLAGTPASAASPTMQQFNALKRQVTQLKNRLNSLQALVNSGFSCHQQVLAVSQYNGYLFDQNGTLFTTTAIDVADGTQSEIYIQTVEPHCVESTGRMALAAFTPHTLTPMRLVRLELAK
jgi:hypothetical protein